MDQSFSGFLGNFSSVYLAFVSLVGVVLNSKALCQLAEVTKVRQNNFSAMCAT